MGAFKWTKEALREEAAKYPTRQAFRKGHPSARTTASRRGYMDEFFGPPPFRWTHETLVIEAAKYKTRSEFQQARWGAYEAARRLGLVETLIPAGSLASDRDTVYWLKARRKNVGGHAVHKFGLTSRRCGTKRVDELNLISGYLFEIVDMSSAGALGPAAEKCLLRLGKPFETRGFSGCTELRLLTPMDYIKAASLMEFLRCWA